MAQQSVSPQSGRSLTIGTEIPQTREKCIIEQKNASRRSSFPQAGITWLAIIKKWERNKKSAELRKKYRAWAKICKRHAKMCNKFSFGVQITAMKGIPGQLLLNKRVVTQEWRGRWSGKKKCVGLWKKWAIISDQIERTDCEMAIFVRKKMLNKRSPLRRHCSRKCSNISFTVRWVKPNRSSLIVSKCVSSYAAAIASL